MKVLLSLHGQSDDLGFASLAPAGYYIALGIGFAFPSQEINALPAEWVSLYTQRGYMLYDPVLKWLYENTGTIRWSEIALADPRGVLGEAKAFGLTYGAAICFVDPGQEGQRTFGMFSRSDREFEAAEIAWLNQGLSALRQRRMPPRNLTLAELEALRMVKNGLLLKQIAAVLGVSDGAVKQRLKNARLKLNAKTGTQAASMATAFGLI